MQFDLYLYITVRGNGTTVNVSLRAMSWSLSTFKHIHHSTNDFYHITFRTDLIIDVSGLMACPGKKFFFFSEAPQRQPKNQWRRLKWWSRKQLPRDPPLMYRFQVPGDDAARYATIRTQDIRGLKEAFVYTRFEATTKKLRDGNPFQALK